MRKLATCTLAYSAAALTAVYGMTASMQLWVGSILLLLCIGHAVVSREKRLRLTLIFGGMAVAMLWTFLHTQLWIVPGEKLTGESIVITGRVLEFPEKTEYNETVEIKLTGDQLPHIRVKLSSYAASLTQLEPGDEVRGTVKFTSALVRGGEPVRYTLAKGIYQVGYLKGELEVTGHYAGAIAYFPKYLARYMVEKIEMLFPADVSHFMQALLIGEGDLLRKDYVLENALERSGLIHIASVSGIHLAFLVGFIRQITGRGKKTAYICVPVILIFAAMTGGQPAIIRSSMMQILLLIAQSVDREHDSITTLSLALFLMLFLNPQAAASISLQLSFTAVAGIYLITPRIQSWLEMVFGGRERMQSKVGKRILYFVYSSVSASLGAIALTAPISAFYFGAIPLLSIVSNLLVSPVIALILNLGLIACMLGSLLMPLAQVIAAFVTCFLRYIIWIAKVLGGLPFAAVYTSNPLVVLWFVSSYLFILISYMFKGKKRTYRPVIPLCLSLSFLCVIMLFTFMFYEFGDGHIAVLDVSQGQSIVFFAGKNTMMIDCGGSASGRAGDIAADYLAGRNRQQVDLLVLTHLHADHANGVTKLLARMPVKTIAMPMDLEDSDQMLPEIYEMAETQGTQIIYITEDVIAQMQRMSTTLFAPIGDRSMNERGIIIQGAVDGYTYLVTGDVDSQTEKMLLAEKEVRPAVLFVAGHHGSRYSSCDALLQTLHPQVVVISVGYNTYGHPTTETLERLQAVNAEIYRTDLSGTVDIRIASVR